jgi:hypothetical protein
MLPLFLKINVLLVGIKCLVLSSANYSIELTEIKFYLGGIKCCSSTDFLCIFIQILIQQGQINAVIII